MALSYDTVDLLIPKKVRILGRLYSSCIALRDDEAMQA